MLSMNNDVSILFKSYYSKLLFSNFTVTSQNWHVVNNEWHSSTEENQSKLQKSAKIEQKHKGASTRDIECLRFYQSTTNKQLCTSSCTKLHLWCVKLCHRKRKCSEHVLKKPTRRFLERMKKRSKESEKSDEAEIAGVSAVSHPISRHAIRKPKTSKQTELVEFADVTVNTRKEIKQRKQRREKERDERKEKERKKRINRHEHEEEISYAHDEDRVMVDHVVSSKLPLLPSSLPTDFTKSCCYLCAQNTMAIAATIIKPQQSDKCIQVSAHELRVAMSPKLDKSCSPLLLIHTVQSSIKVRTRETSTPCPGTNKLQHKEMRPKTRKNFALFSNLMRTKCPTEQYSCKTDKITKLNDNARKRKLWNEECCKKKNA